MIFCVKVDEVLIKIQIHYCSQHIAEQLFRAVHNLRCACKLLTVHKLLHKFFVKFSTIFDWFIRLGSE